MQVKVIVSILTCLLLASCNLWPRHSADVTGDPQGDDATSPSCIPDRVGLSVRAVTNGSGAAPPTCAVDENGRVIMEYDTSSGCAFPEPFRGCRVAVHRDARQFMAGGGVYEAHVCAEGSLDGALNLWFEDPDFRGTAEGRMNLPIVMQGEPFVSTCRRVWAEARDLSFPGRCPARVDQMSAVCKATNDAGVTDTLVTPTDGPVRGTEGDAGPVDRGDARVPDAQPTFASAELTFMAEWCVPARTSASPPRVRVTLMSVVYYPTSCMCRSDGECRAQGPCRRDYWPDNACCWCDGECAGVCTPQAGGPP